MVLKHIKAAIGWKYYKNITPLPPHLRDSFFVFFSVPKSGANTVVNALAELLKLDHDPHQVPPAMVFPSGLGNQLPLHRDLARLHPKGGWHHTHAEASFPTLEVLRTTGSKYLVQSRHPLDQLVANYCHLRKFHAAAPAVPGHPEWFYAMPFAIYRRKYFEPQTPLDAGLAHMIEEGALTASLRWMADWACFRDREHSHVFSFEDFIHDRVGLVGEICQFLRPGAALSSMEIAQTVARAAEDYKRHSLSLANEESYPHGWTGEIGIWKKYFSRENLAKYRRVAGDFLRTHPTAHALVELYPDWEGAESVLPRRLGPPGVVNESGGVLVLGFLVPGVWTSERELRGWPELLTADYSDEHGYRIDLVVTGAGKKLAVECDGERFHGPEKLQEDMDRQAILERLGWKFVRIRGSIFFRDEDRAMRPVSDRLEELGITVDMNFPTAGILPVVDSVSQQAIRRAQELRAIWKAEKCPTDGD